jgi:hypothetical protein
VNAPAGPGTGTETLPTWRGKPHGTRRTRDEDHQGRTQRPSPSAGSLNRSREESQRHQPHLATTTSNKPPACSPSSPARAQTTQEQAVLAHRCTSGVAARMASGHRGSTRHHAHQTVPIPRTVAPQPIEAWALGLYRRRAIYRAEPCRRMIRHSTMGHVRDLLARCQQNTTDDTPTCRCATDATRRTSCINHYRPSEDETEQWRCPAATPTPDAPLVRAPSGRTPGKTSPWTPVCSSNQEWNTVYKDQAGVQTHSTGPHQQ